MRGPGWRGLARLLAGWLLFLIATFGANVPAAADSGDTLRLVRAGIGLFSLGDLPPGAFQLLGAADRTRLFAR